MAGSSIKAPADGKAIRYVQPSKFSRPFFPIPFEFINFLLNCSRVIFENIFATFIFTSDFRENGQILMFSRVYTLIQYSHHSDTVEAVLSINDVNLLIIFFSWSFSTVMSHPLWPTVLTDTNFMLSITKVCRSLLRLTRIFNQTKHWTQRLHHVLQHSA